MYIHTNTPELLPWILKHKIIVPSVDVLNNIKQTRGPHKLTITGLMKSLKHNKLICSVAQHSVCR